MWSLCLHIDPMGQYNYDHHLPEGETEAGTSIGTTDWEAGVVAEGRNLQATAWLLDQF